jgi:nitroalkane oxidase
MTHPSFDPRTVMNNDAVEFTKEMEGIDTLPGPIAHSAPLPV